MAEIIPEGKLRQAVDQVFKKYDINKNSRLEKFEILGLFKDTLVFLGSDRLPGLVEADEFIEYADLKRDNKIDKEEMLVVFKKAIANYSKKK